MLLKMRAFRKPIYIQTGILFAAFAGLYFPFIITMVQDWNTNANYSHGYLIPLITGYMIYNMRRELQGVEISPSNLGLPLIVLGLAQLVVARIGSEYFLQRTSMIVVFFGLSLFLVGKDFTKKVSIPVIYLIFMIPIPAIIWNKVAFPMQLFASGITEWVIQVMGIPVFREGNILHLAETSLEVADACSGIRSLVSMLALSGAFAYLSELSRLKQWLLFLSAAPIAILINIIRLTLTAGLASRFGEKVAQGFMHEFSGWLIFLLGLAMLAGVYVFLLKAKIKHAESR